MDRFVPRAVRTHVSSHGPLLEPSVTAMHGTVLLADLSGFTRLAAALAAAPDGNAAGAEELTRVLNEHFSRLIAIVEDHGGDVIKFAGDALQILFASALSAARCALACCEAFPNARARSRSVMGSLSTTATPRSELSLHCGIASGELFACFVGGVGGRFEYLLAGPTCAALAAAVDAAGPGEVVVDDAMHAKLSSQFSISSSPIAGTTPPVHRLQGITSTVVEPGAAEPAGTLGPATGCPGLEAFVPSFIVSRLAAGQSDWLSEMRRATIVFVQLLVDFTCTESLTPLQDSITDIQTIMQRTGGVLRQAIQDDKGILCIGAYGIPPVVNPNAHINAVDAALSIVDTLPVRCRIGLATGMVLVGPVGAPHRQEIALVGPPVNLAARLMARAVPVLCDEETSRQSAVEALEPIKVKGLADPVAVFRPMRQRDCGTRPPSSVAPLRCIGRDAEQALIRAMLMRLLDGGTATGGFGGIVLDGGPGLGKSTLLGVASETARNLLVPVLTGHASAFETETPLVAFRGIVAGVAGSGSAMERQARVVDRVQEGGQTLQASIRQQQQHLQQHLPRRPVSALSRRFQIVTDDEADSSLKLVALLNDVDPSLGFEETSQSRAFSGQARADALNSVLLRLVVGASPALLLIEDLHWLDSLSWRLLVDIARFGSRTAVLATTRPLPHTNFSFDALVAMAAVEHIKLQPLAGDAFSALARDRMGAETVSPEVHDLLFERSQGHPFFCQELAMFLKQSHVVEVDDSGTAVLAPGIDAARIAGLPRTIEGTVATRINQLSDAAEFVIKVASVIGRRFDIGLLQAVHPVPDDRARLPDLLLECVRAEILIDEGGGAYLFFHALTEDVAYSLLLGKQKQELHQRVADILQTQHRGNLDPVAFLLGTHLARAEAFPDAIRFLARAARTAASQNGNLEVIKILTDVFGLAKVHHLGSVMSQNEWASLEVLLGRALLLTGQGKPATVHLREGLRLFHRPFPRTAVGVVMGLLGQFVSLRRIYKWTDELGKTGGRITSKLSPDDQLRHDAIGRACEVLAEALFFQGRDQETLLAVLMSMSAAVRLDAPNGLLVAGLLAVGSAMALVRLHPIGRRIHRVGVALVIDNPEREEELLEAMPYIYLHRAMYHAVFGEAGESYRMTVEGVPFAVRTGNRRRRDELLFNMLMATLIHGDLALFEEALEPLHQSAEEHNDSQAQLWSASMAGLAGIRFGRTVGGRSPEVCLATCEEVAASGRIHVELMDRLFVDTLRALVRPDDRAAAQTVLETWLRCQPSSFGVGFCFPGIAAVHFGDLRSLARIVRHADRHAQSMIIARPAGLRCRAMLARARGQTKKALVLLGEAHRECVRQAMRWDSLAAAVEAERLGGGIEGLDQVDVLGMAAEAPADLDYLRAREVVF